MPHNLRKHILNNYIYVVPKYDLEEYKKWPNNNKDDTPIIVRNDGIEFKEGNETIHVGIQGAHVHLYIPIID